MRTRGHGFGRANRPAPTARELLLLSNFPELAGSLIQNDRGLTTGTGSYQAMRALQVRL